MKSPIPAITTAAFAAALTTTVGLAGIPDGWHHPSAYPAHNSLNALWAEAESSVYVAGDGGVVLHWDGTGWTTMETPTERPLFGIHGSAPDNIWAVGGDSYRTTNDDNSVVLRYDGSAWHNVPAPADRFGQRLTLSAVWAVSPTEVWAITETNLSLFRWDGSRWHDSDYAGQIAGAFLEGGMHDLRHVDGLGLFLVGTHGQIIRYDGSTWHLEQKLETGGFSTNIMTCIYAVDANNVFAGHNWGTIFKRNPDGTWTDLELGEGGFFGSGQILDIRGGSPADLHFVVDRTLRHFTGAAPTSNTKYGSEVRGSWQAADAAGDQLFIVSNAGALYRYDTTGGQLHPLTAAHRTTFQGRINGATAYGDSGLLLHGSGLHYPEPMALATYTGHTIDRYPADALPEGASDTADVIHATTSPSGEVSLVFEDLSTRRNGIFTHAAGDWVRRQGFFLTNGLRLDYADDGTLFVSDAQSVAYWPSLEAQPVELLRLPVEQTLEQAFTAIWAPTTDRVFVGGLDGQIRRWDGASWNTETTIADTDIGALAGHGADVYAIAYEDGSFGDRGTLWHRSAAGTWSELVLLPELALKPVGFAQGTDGLYLAFHTPGNFFGGGRTFVRKLEGASAIPVVDGLTGQFQAITNNAQGDIYLVRSDGRMFTNRPRPESFTPATVALQAGNWQALLPAGIEIAANATAPNTAYVTAWHAHGAVLAAPTPEGYQLGLEYWVLDHDAALPVDGAPTFTFRFYATPGALPDGADPSNAVLLRHDGTVWHPVPATYNAAQGYYETTTPTTTSTWVVGFPDGPPSGPPTLTIERTSPTTITLTWPNTPGLQLVSSTDATAGSWSAVTGTPVEEGDRLTLTVEITSVQQFFRLQE